MKDLSAYSSLSKLDLGRILTSTPVAHALTIHAVLSHNNCNAVFLFFYDLTFPLSDNCFSEIFGLEQCTKLTHLNLEHNKISKISGLSTLRLTHLSLVSPTLSPSHMQYAHPCIITSTNFNRRTHFSFPLLGSPSIYMYGFTSGGLFPHTGCLVSVNRRIHTHTLTHSRMLHIFLIVCVLSHACWLFILICPLCFSSYLCFWPHFYIQ